MSCDTFQSNQENICLNSEYPLLNHCKLYNFSFIHHKVLNKVDADIHLPKKEDGVQDLYNVLL